MPLGVISEADLANEMLRFNGSLPSHARAKVIDPEILEREIIRGRNGAKEVPLEIRALAAQELISGAKPDEVARALGISAQSANAYKNDATSLATYNSPNADLKEKNDEFRDKIKDLASTRLIAAIESITADKLADSKINVASAVARDMSQVIKNTTPESAAQVNNQVIIYKPRMREEDDYEVIDISRSEGR